MKIAALIATIVILFSASPVDASANSKKMHLSGTWNQKYVEGWALDRINQSQVKLDGNKVNVSSGGTGVTVYVIDTGVGAEDCNGHGTIIADIISGDTYGIAKGAEIISVKALDCDGSGTEAQVISAVNWVYQNAEPETSVVNMSLIGIASSPIDAAVNRLGALVPVVVAAGNRSSDACNFSPARASNVIAVAGFDQYNLRSIFSNHGLCVDIWAPGTAIDAISKDGTRVQKSGTSMSAAITSGTIALIADRDNVTTKIAAQTMISQASRPYFVDARLNGKAAYAVWVRD
jgi:serine protease